MASLWPVRAGVGAVTVVIAAGVNVATGMLTQHWALAWWLFTITLVVAGAGAQAWLILADRDGSGQQPGPRRVRAVGDGSIAAGGSVRGSSTCTVQSGTRRAASGLRADLRPEEPEEEVAALGRGSIAAGQDVEDSRTSLSDPSSP
jgi:hypothetical protein